MALTSIPDSPTPDSQPPAALDGRRTRAADIHRRETCLHIVLPVAGGGLLIAVLAVLTLLLPQRGQASLIADLMSVFLLCPLAICLFPIYMVMMVVALGMNRVHDEAARPLRRMEGLSRELANRTLSVSETIARITVIVLAQFSVLDPLWDVFDRPKEIQEHELDSTEKQ